jgi:hypothetical protein
MNAEQVSLTDPDISLKLRKRQFNRYLTEYDEQDSQLLSSRIKVTPQVVTAFYELNLLSDREVEELDAKRLDLAVLSLLLNLTPTNRASVLLRLDEFLKDKEPLTRITKFVSDGAGRMTIDDVVEQVDSQYWWALAKFLSQNDFNRGTINASFRNMLRFVAQGRASRSQKNWLDRGIRMNFGNGLGVFEAPNLKKQFPKDVQIIETFWSENSGDDRSSGLL